jgi:hypothetical protein
MAILSSDCSRMRYIFKYQLKIGATLPPIIRKADEYLYRWAVAWQ